jgi:hypothetical protein
VLDDLSFSNDARVTGSTMNWLFGNPQLINYITMSLYACNVVWQLAHGKWADACYWTSALGITATVTFGYKH